MSVYKRGKTWTAHAKWTDSKGKKHQETKGGFHGKKDATKYEREILTRVDSGRHIASTGLSFSDYLNDMWLPRRRELKNLKESTYETYKMLIAAYIEPQIGSMRIDEIRTHHIESFFIEMLCSGRKKNRKDGIETLSAKTVRNIASIIHTGLKDAVRLELIAFNPSDSAIKPKVNAPEVDFMTPDNLMKYVGSIQDHRYGTALQLVALTGMRRGEILGLSWNAVDFKNGKIKIHRTRIRAGNRTIFDTPKSDKSKRTIEIDADTMNKLRIWKIEQIKERLALGGTWSDQEDLVVTDLEGKAPSFSAFDRMFKRTLKNAGLEQMKFHSLRHSYVIAALRSGGQLKVVSERVGHSDTAITQKVYNHVVDGEDRQVADNTAAFILGIPLSNHPRSEAASS